MEYSCEDCKFFEIDPITGYEFCTHRDRREQDSKPYCFNKYHMLGGSYEPCINFIYKHNKGSRVTKLKDDFTMLTNDDLVKLKDSIEKELNARKTTRKRLGDDLHRELLDFYYKCRRNGFDIKITEDTEHNTKSLQIIEVEE